METLSQRVRLLATEAQRHPPVDYEDREQPTPKMGSLEESQVRRAVGALLKHVKLATVGNPKLVEEGQIILAQMSLHKIPGDVKVKPIPIAIPHPLRQRDDCDMCLIVKDDAKAWLKDMVEKEPVEGLTKIIKLQNIRSQYSEFKERRKLLNEFDLFLADDRILPMLTKALGKTFLKVKKQPVPVRLERRSSLASQISRARDSAFLCGSYGDCWAVKLATTAMTEDQVVANLMAGIAAVVDKIPRKWKNVKGINIKCSDSVALPVYSFVGDIPPTPPAATAVAKEEAGEGEKPSGSTKADVQVKRRKPRPLIRQQLNKIKEDTKAEKALAAGATATNGSAGSKKQAVSEVEVPVAGNTDGGESVGGGSGGSSKKKRKSLVSTTAAVDDASPRVKTGKRRRS